METLSVALARCDGGTQSRAFFSEPVIAEYKEAMLRGVQFEPIVVFFDGTDYWVADGFHRVRAARDGGIPELAADIRQGTVRDAILYSVGANSKHGLKRCNADKRRAVNLLLDDEEWGGRSNRWIAEQCGVDHKFVEGERKPTGDIPSCQKRMGMDGKARQLPKARATTKAPELSPSPSGADSASPPNKSSDERTTLPPPAPPDGEPKQAPAPTKADLPFPSPSAPSLSSSDETPLTTGRAPFETPLDLCKHIAAEDIECLADFDWLVSEATRLVEENQ